MDNWRKGINYGLKGQGHPRGTDFRLMPGNPNSRYLGSYVTKDEPQATTSPNRPVFSNTKSFLVDSLYVELLVSDHLS